MPPTSSILPALLTLAALIHPLALVFGRLDWRIDLLTHFSEPALAVTLVALGMVAWRRWRWLAMGLVGLAALQGQRSFGTSGAIRSSPTRDRRRGSGSSWPMSSRITTATTTSPG